MTEKQQIIDDKDLAEDAFDQIYNKAVEHCCMIVRTSLAWLHQEEVDQVISNIEKLKKP